jgi:TolA-binding protein
VKPEAASAAAADEAPRAAETAVAVAPGAAPIVAAREVTRAAPREREKPAPAAPESASRPSVASFAPAPSTPVDEGSLRQETALMERALSALRRGDVQGARQALAEHASRFPNGHLVRERERALERTLGKETDHAAK